MYTYIYICIHIDRPYAVLNLVHEEWGDVFKGATQDDMGELDAWLGSVGALIQNYGYYSPVIIMSLKYT